VHNLWDGCVWQSGQVRDRWEKASICGIEPSVWSRLIERPWVVQDEATGWAN